MTSSTSIEIVRLLHCYIARLSHCYIAALIYSYIVTLKNYKLESVKCYKTSKELGNYVYVLVRKWSILDQKTTGQQVIRSIDSIAANIAEGFGRFHKKDKIKFFYNARASTYESAHWMNVALERKLVSKDQYEGVMSSLRLLPKEINYLIKMTQNNLTI